MTDSSSDAAVVDTGLVDDTTPAAAPQEADKGQQTPDDKGTPSTPDKGEKPSMLDAVKTALKPKPDAPPASQTPDQKQPAADDQDKAKDTPEDDADLKKEPSEEEKKFWSPRTQRRFRKLNADVQARDQLLEQVTPKATEFDKLENFLRERNVSSDNARRSLEIAGLIQTDPAAAYQALLPTMAALEQAIGHVLPPQLQQRVEAGYLSREDALAMNRAAADAEFNKRRFETQQREFEENQRQQSSQDQLDRSVRSVESWEKQKAASDPDWHLKHADVRSAIELEVLRKSRKDPSWIPTPEEALGVAQEAEKQVTARMKQFIPKPTSLPRENAGGASPRLVAEPESLIEAMRASIRR